MLATLPRAALRAPPLPCRRCFHLTLSHRLPRPSHSTRRESIPTRAQIPAVATRCFHTSPRSLSAAPKSHDRGPASKEDTQTDFSSMDMLSATPVPTTAIDACMNDGFALNSGLKLTNSGVLLVGGEAFAWSPWTTPHISGTGLVNAKGQLEPSGEAWGVLGLVWPKPDLLVLGTGRGIVPLSVKTRQRIAEMGIRVEVQDTRNAAAQFNLLATERGVQNVAGAMLPVGWGMGK
ncbi:hypothetical protein B0A48_00410 [Cryoendolithus antarcticus]|uniref:NADH dehydrogenase [ubiquinone] 1 alpha subcomplex assembly factor 3 n=1 Tax=Cryoendolithus antarcticus TaxID=1507870 RepID=A0A1V8TUK0_9PEZI|nr:hypothetical protein B0A48_00410 [Cryoendolithus antarcticus]